MDKITYSLEKMVHKLYDLIGHDKFKFSANVVKINKIKEEMKEGDEVVIGGIIEEAKPIATKKGDMMMFLRISDLTGSIETVVFPKVYAQFKTILEPERCIAIKGKVSNRNNEISLIVDKIKPLQ